MATGFRIGRRVSVFCTALFFSGCTGSEAEWDIQVVPVSTASPAVTFASARAPDALRKDVALTLRDFRSLRPWMKSTENPMTDAKVGLGRKLFEDKALSLHGDMACATCHPLASYGVDGLATSKRGDGKRTARNTPTVFNVAEHVGQFWDGRSANIEEQTKALFLNGTKTGMPDPEALMEIVQKDPAYRKAFRRAFPNESDDGITFDNIAKAIGAFERTLVTPSRWDRFVNGESSALTEPEQAGFQKFVAIGCAICHKGVYLGGDRYRMLGSRVPWPKTNDLGRYRVTGALSDKMVFKVAALRNVERTGPYFHDGSVEKLDEAVKLMARHQLGLELGDEDVQSIVTWLGSLTGTISADLLASENDDSR